jgi:hypothetical protein
MIAEIDNFGAFEIELPFESPIPYANDRGELMIWPQFTFALSSGASHTQQALAWEFMKFATLAPLREDDRLHHGLFTSLMNFNSAARSHAHNTFLHSFGWTPQTFHILQGWHWAGTGWHEAIERLVNYSDNATAMPIRDTRYAPEFVRNVVKETLHQFHDGLITAEQAANDLQNRITLIIMEMD